MAEEVFRVMESDAVRSAAAVDDALVPTGRGVVPARAIRNLMSSTGTVVWLRAAPEVSLNRITGAGNRPLLSDVGGARALASILGSRRSRYESIADHVVDTDAMDLDQTANRVVDPWNR